MEAEQLAGTPPDRGATGGTRLRQQLLQAHCGLGMGEFFRNLILVEHAPAMAQRGCKVKSYLWGKGGPHRLLLLLPLPVVLPSPPGRLFPQPHDPPPETLDLALSALFPPPF